MLTKSNKDHNNDNTIVNHMIWLQHNYNSS